MNDRMNVSIIKLNVAVAYSYILQKYNNILTFKHIIASNYVTNYN